MEAAHHRLLTRPDTIASAEHHDDGELNAAVARARRATTTVRLRLVGIVCLSAMVTLILASELTGETLPAHYTHFRLFGLLSMSVFIAASYRPGFVRHQHLWGWLLVTLVAGLTAYGAARRGNPPIAAMLESLLVLLTSVTLPWGVGMQMATIASASLTLAACAWELDLFRRDHPDLPVLVYATAAFVASLVVARATRNAFDNAVSENLRLEEARARIRALAEHLDAKVRARTAELEASLADQRAMTRAISHDLRQPLRHIAGFSQVLSDEVGRGLDERHREQLGRVVMATARMDQMVDALLEISRVAGQPVRYEPIDVTGMARELGEMLSRLEADRAVELVVRDGLRAEGDAGLVRSLLHAILANAWKFTRNTEKPRIEVGRRGDAFYVRDNGSGFDMQYASRLFQTFERLHHKDEYEGEGVGLTIAQRVVRRHGGRIWAESEPGRGATFFFTLSAGA